MRVLASVLLVVCALGCNVPKANIEDKEWELVALGERDHPLGNGGRPVTLRFDAKSKTAGGNAGCNRYNGTYVLTSRKLTFGPAVVTRMACAEGMDVEKAWLAALAKVTTWSATESTLVLADASGPLATFEVRRAP